MLVRYGGTYAIYNSADGLNYDTLRMVADARGGKNDGTEQVRRGNRSSAVGFPFADAGDDIIGFC